MTRTHEIAAADVPQFIYTLPANATIVSYGMSKDKAVFVVFYEGEGNE